MLKIELGAARLMSGNCDKFLKVGGGFYEL